VLICDTSGLLAAYAAGEAQQGNVLETLKGDPGPLVLSPFVLAELNYLVGQRAGVRPELDVLSDVASGVYQLADFSRSDVAAAARVVRRYADLHIGLTDASIVVLADRFQTTRLLTLDERHFRTVRPLRAEAFTILPADA
jgi:hypothetical protein